MQSTVNLISVHNAMLVSSIKEATKGLVQIYAHLQKLTDEGVARLSTNYGMVCRLHKTYQEN
jgi:hypothetical protein